MANTMVGRERRGQGLEVLLQLPQDGSSLHVARRQIRHELLGCNTIQADFECLKVLPQSLNVVQRYLYSAVVHLAESVRFLLFFPC